MSVIPAVNKDVLAKSNLIWQVINEVKTELHSIALMLPLSLHVILNDLGY